MKVFLQKLIQGTDLSQQETKDAFDAIMAGEATPAQLAGLLVALRMRGETVEEIAGAAQSMRRHAVFVDPRGMKVVDTCGTGGDALGTFNVSTTAALVAAGAGARLAKHGNRAMTSQCGSADVLAELGVNLEAPPHIMEECLHEVGFAFLFAPKLHPAMKHAVGPRRELGVRTIFNLLGPLTNPAGARCQVLGVFAATWTEPMADVLRRLGSQHVLVVHGHDGMDEITVTTRTRISELRDGRIRTYDFDPREIIGDYKPMEELSGGAPTVNADLVRRLLDGEKGPRRDIVCLNAGAALMVAGLAKDMAEGFWMAGESIDSGRAAAVLQALVERTRA